jgi:hypothetical protein
MPILRGQDRAQITAESNAKWGRNSVTDVIGVAMAVPEALPQHLPTQAAAWL